MEIVDLSEKYRNSYFLCLEEWSAEMREAGDHKSLWYEKMKDKGLTIKLALNDKGVPVGMIQYLPIENSYIKGRGLYFILCIWVHGHKEGPGNFQKRGYGKALLREAEDDARMKGAEGMAAWGLLLPFWMKASWFKKHGYTVADRDGMATLMWKPFSEKAVKPEWIKGKIKPAQNAGKVTVTAFKNGWCPAQNMVYERAKKASKEFGGRVIFSEIDTLDEKNLCAWGYIDALFIDEKQVRTGPPPAYDKIRKKIAKKLKKSGLA